MPAHEISTAIFRGCIHLPARRLSIDRSITNRTSNFRSPSSPASTRCSSSPFLATEMELSLKDASRTRLRVFARRSRFDRSIDRPTDRSIGQRITIARPRLRADTRARAPRRGGRWRTLRRPRHRRDRSISSAIDAAFCTRDLSSAGAPIWSWAPSVCDCG